MADEPTQEGGASQSDADGLDKNTGADKTPRRDPKLVERDALLADMDAKIEAQRAQENEAFLRDSGADPQRLMLARQMEREAAGKPLEGEEAPAGDEEPADLEDGTQYVEPTRTAPAPARREAQRVSNKGDDPLGEYVVRVNGKPMMKLIVDGQEKLIPLENARAQLQKHTAADIRLQDVARQRKELENRAAVIKAQEQELGARRAAPAAAPVDDKALDVEATELVRSLVSEPEAQAAARLAKTLKTIRQAATPQIDPKAIAKLAADEAEARIVARDTGRAMTDGLAAFKANYPDVAGDPDLFALADRKTDAIAEEHPEWSPQQVMDEAGRQTHEWMKAHGMAVRPGIRPANGGTNNRQQRKEGLRPMPTPRAARPAPAQAQSDVQSPSDAVAEMRKARGQPA